MHAHPYRTFQVYPLGLSSRLPDAQWPQSLLDLYRTAYALRRAAQTLWQLAQGADWRDQPMTLAYRAAYDALDKVELIAAPELRAWEASHSA